MNKRLAIILLIAFLSMQLGFLNNVYASPAISASYSKGQVKVEGTGFLADTGYMLRIVNKTANSIAALGQTKSDSNGSFSASITTGLLGKLTDYVVYVNNMKGEFIAEADISDATPLPSSSAPPAVSPSTSPSISPSNSPSISPSPITSPPVINPQQPPAPTVQPQPNPTPVPAPTPAPTTQTVIETVKAEAELDANGSRLSAKVEAKAIETALQKILETKNEGKPAIVEIKAEISSAAGSQIKEAEIKIPKASVEKISQTESTSLKIDAGTAIIKFDGKAVSAINSSAGSDVVVAVKKLDSRVLSDEIKQKVQDRPVYQFEVITSDSKISDFKGGNAEVDLPYALKEGEDPSAIVVYYIDAANNLKVVRGRYNEKTRTVIFKTTHFSKYAVGYNKVSFKDVAQNAWYSKAVSFAAAREIVKGVGEQKFAPEANVKRADFLIMVMKAYGIQPDGSITDNFSDAGSRYYTPYLATAKKLGLATGIGNNKFAPEAAITRQDMMVILYRMLEKIGELPSVNGIDSGKSISSFKDANDVSEYAKQAIDRFIQTGIVSGDGSRINPKVTSTRAHAVQLLYNLLSR